LITERINLADIITGSNHARRYNPFYKIGFDIIDAAATSIQVMTDEIATKLHDEYQSLAREYIHTLGHKYAASRREKASRFFYSELKRKFNSQMRSSSSDLTNALIP